MSELTDLPNIGPRLADALIKEGITSPDELAKVGSLEAWWRIHPTFHCLHSLFSLEAALQGIPKSQLSEVTRQRLRKDAQNG